MWLSMQLAMQKNWCGRKSEGDEEKDDDLVGMASQFSPLARQTPQEGKEERPSFPLPFLFLRSLAHEIGPVLWRHALGFNHYQYNG